MRAIPVFSVVLLALSAMTGCAASAPQPAKVAEPIVYNAADYNPPSEFDMTFAQSDAKGPAIKRSEPAETSYRARLVSMEKPE
ncbi:MAG: hypothetical protein ACLQVI_34120 [Polyangiaceae bacterium]